MLRAGSGLRALWLPPSPIYWTPPNGARFPRWTEITRGRPRPVLIAQKAVPPSAYLFGETAAGFQVG